MLKLTIAIFLLINVFTFRLEHILPHYIVDLGIEYKSGNKSLKLVRADLFKYDLRVDDSHNLYFSIRVDATVGESKPEEILLRAKLVRYI
jgi:hypothetical protein